MSSHQRQNLLPISAILFVLAGPINGVSPGNEKPKAQTKASVSAITTDWYALYSKWAAKLGTGGPTALTATTLLGENRTSCACTSTCTKPSAQAIPLKQIEFIPEVVLPILRRTVQEDRVLREKLKGYAAYAQNVRSRLFPGVW